ncbi:MAG: AAA family ATPase [Phycisphaerales bacterium]|jgi:MoxR-like ATPase|nr:AAA family ATPase [Phycisphaerales bacterium]
MILSEKHLPDQITTSEEVRQALETIRLSFLRMRQQIGNVIVGHQRVIDLVLVSIFSEGHVLLEGPPGLGKTLLVRTLGDVLALSNARIQCTADLMPADIVGTTIVDEKQGSATREFRYQEGPIFHQLVLVDEINRATPKTQSAMLEAMQERAVTVDGVTRKLPDPFFVLATQNPIEQEGTYPLPEAQLDRFIFKIDVKHSDRVELNRILERTTSTDVVDTDVTTDASFLLKAQDVLKRVVIAPHIQDFVTRLVLATHPDSEHASSWVSRDVLVGASPRGAQAVIRSAKVAAVMDQRFAVSLRDIQAVAVPALQHRIVRTFEAQTANRHPASIIEEILEGVPILDAGAFDG